MGSEVIRVIVVDDHALHRDGTRQILAAHPDLQVVGDAASGEEALALVNKLHPGVVLMDIRLPGMNGIELLAEFGRLVPHAPRILLTGYADKEGAIKAINEVGLFQFIEKPWDNDHLLMVLRNALEKRFLFQALQEKIAELDRAEGRLSGLQEDILRTFI